MKHYQAIIIGFGKAGKTLAVSLAKEGWKVALIEQSQQMYGGTCINIGCIPTKSLVHDAEMHNGFVAAMYRKSSVVGLLREKNFNNLNQFDGIDIINGHAEFINSQTIRVTGGKQSLELTSDKIFINTGAEAIIPEIKGLTSTPGIYDSTGLLSLKKRPERLGIIGGGYIGVEFASMFAQFGTKVTILETSPQFLPREDPDISVSIQSILESQGVELKLNTHIESVMSENGEVKIATEEQTFYVDAVLVASGRRPATTSLQLQNAGVDIDQRGAIIVDEYLRTSANNIWAMGDVTGGLQFTYISLDDYRIVRDQLLGEGKRRTTDRLNIPYSVFLSPTLSRIGITETQARNNGTDIQVAVLPVTAIPRAHVINDTRGMLKVIVDNKSQQILGAALLCADSHEVINIIKTVMDAKLSYKVLRDQIFTHPTMSESLNDLLNLINDTNHKNIH